VGAGAAEVLGLRPLQCQMTGQSLFRACFSLLPLLHQAETDWTLAYFLQAADDQSFIDAGVDLGTTQLNWSIVLG